MPGFEELGRKLDKLSEGIKAGAQSGVEKTAKQAKDWRKKLDELGEKTKKTTQEGVSWFTTEAKEFGQITKFRTEIRQTEKNIDELYSEIGAKTYELHLQKKIGNVQLKSLGAKITRLKKEMETKEKRIQNLKKRS